jgi:hypothetical protein
MLHRTLQFNALFQAREDLPIVTIQKSSALIALQECVVVTTANSRERGVQTGIAAALGLHNRTPDQTDCNAEYTIRR